jgi:hypothetical protein
VIKDAQTQINDAKKAFQEQSKAAESAAKDTIKALQND